jgi:hypothetical protein
MSDMESDGVGADLFALFGIKPFEPLEPLEPLEGLSGKPRRNARARNTRRAARNKRARSVNAYRRRTLRAVRLGYKSYYDYRTHNYGELPPEQKVTPALRERLRGHRSYRDLVHALERLPAGAIVAPVGLNRDSDGRWRGVSFLILYPDGREKEFLLRGRQASEQALKGLRDLLQELGIGWLSAPSLDVFAASESEGLAA